MDKWEQLFSYSYRTGNIYECEKHVVKHEKTAPGKFQFFTVQKKCKLILRGNELSGFLRFAAWMLERGADFGEINDFILSEAGKND